MSNKSNYDHLKELCIDNVEALEFIEAAENEYKDLQIELHDSQAEVERIQGNLDEMGDPSDYKDVFLGLDTLSYRLEHGNIHIQAQLENWINQVKKQNCAGVEIP